MGATEYLIIFKEGDMKAATTDDDAKDRVFRKS